MAILDDDINSILDREENKVQRHVYYMSKRLISAKVYYNPIKKLAYALAIFDQKLKLYF